MDQSIFVKLIFAVVLLGTLGTSKPVSKIVRPKRSLLHGLQRTDVNRDTPDGHLSESESFRPKRELMSKNRPKITDFTQNEHLRPKRSLLHRHKRTDVGDTTNGHLAEIETVRPKRELMNQIRPKKTELTQNDYLRPKQSLSHRPKRTCVRRVTTFGHLAVIENLRPKHDIISQIRAKISDFTQNEHLRPKRSEKRNDRKIDLIKRTVLKLKEFKQTESVRPKRIDVEKGQEIRLAERIRHNTGHTEGTQNTKRINAKHEKEYVLINRIQHKKSLLIGTDAHKKALREEMKTTRALEKTYLNKDSTFHGEFSVLEERLIRYLCRKRGQQSDRKKALCSEIELLESYTRFWGNSALPPFPAHAFSTLV